MSVYEKDFYAWTREQATLLREQQYARLDLDNLIEEIEGMGRSEYPSFTNSTYVVKSLNK